MSFNDGLELVVHGFEALGVVILVVGCVVAFVNYSFELRKLDRKGAYRNLRGNVGRTILLGLEVLIVADIVLTVAIDRTLESTVALGLIVLVRTFLSISIDIELEGVVPWHLREAEVKAGTRGDLDL